MTTLTTDGALTTLDALRADLAAWAAALEPAGPPAWADPRAARRLMVHRNTVQKGLADALAAAYPATTRAVGPAFMAAAARRFAAGETRRAATLALYGDGFAAFLATLPAAAAVPWLVDLARLERAVLEATHAADAPALAPADLAPLLADLPHLRFQPHPATRLVRSAHPIVQLWRANRAAAAGPITATDAAEAALVTRPDDATNVTSLDPAAAAFAAALLAGETPEAAAAPLGPRFDPTPTFARLLADGAFAAPPPFGDPT